MKDTLGGIKCCWNESFIERWENKKSVNEIEFILNHVYKIWKKWYYWISLPNRKICIRWHDFYISIVAINESYNFPRSVMKIFHSVRVSGKWLFRKFFPQPRWAHTLMTFNQQNIIKFMGKIYGIIWEMDNLLYVSVFI